MVFCFEMNLKIPIRFQPVDPTSWGFLELLKLSMVNSSGSYGPRWIMNMAYNFEILTDE